MSNIAQKIAKLIEKADSTSHPEEAETFMSKAHELMTAHGLNLLDLGRLSEDPVGVDKDVWDHSSSYGWMVHVASAACKYYGVEWARLRKGRDMVYTISGRESARVTFLLMMPYLEREVKRIARREFNAGKYSSRMTAATRVGNALASRIWDMVPSVKQYKGEGVNALVPVDLNRAALEKLFPKMRKARATVTKFDSNAAEAVKEINLNRQTGGKSTKRLEAR